MDNTISTIFILFLLLTLRSDARTLCNQPGCGFSPWCASQVSLICGQAEDGEEKCAQVVSFECGLLPLATPDDKDDGKLLGENELQIQYDITNVTNANQSNPSWSSFQTLQSLGLPKGVAITSDISTDVSQLNETNADIFGGNKMTSPSNPHQKLDKLKAIVDLLFLFNNTNEDSPKPTNTDSKIERNTVNTFRQIHDYLPESKNSSSFNKLKMIFASLLVPTKNTNNNDPEESSHLSTADMFANQSSSWNTANSSSALEENVLHTERELLSYTERPLDSATPQPSFSSNGSGTDTGKDFVETSQTQDKKHLIVPSTNNATSPSNVQVTPGIIDPDRVKVIMDSIFMAHKMATQTRTTTAQSKIVQSKPNLLVDIQSSNVPSETPVTTFKPESETFSIRAKDKGHRDEKGQKPSVDEEKNRINKSNTLQSWLSQPISPCVPQQSVLDRVVEVLTQALLSTTTDIDSLTKGYRILSVSRTVGNGVEVDLLVKLKNETCAQIAMNAHEETANQRVPTWKTSKIITVACPEDEILSLPSCPEGSF